MKKSVFSSLAAAALLTLGAAHAQMIPITVPNASFESPAATSPGSPYDVSDSGQVITDWTGTTSDARGNNNPFGVSNNSILTTPGTSDGSQSAYIQVYYNYTNAVLVTNNPLATIAPNTTYTLTVAAGAPINPSTFDGAQGTTGEVAAQLDFFLLANGTAVASQTVANTAVLQGTLQDYTISFTTGASGGVIGQNLTIALEADKAFYPGPNADPGSEAAIFDNVRLTETPEPSTWALMLGGMGILILLTRRNLLKA